MTDINTLSFDEVQHKLIKLQSRLAKLDAELTVFKKLRNNMCQHTKITERSYYFGGSYYNESYTDYWNECDICGAKSATTTKSWGHYG